MIEAPGSSKPAETAVLIGLVTDDQNADQVKEYLDELEFLATTAGITTLKRFTQKLHKPEGRTYIGSGLDGGARRAERDLR
jgi:GTP-binding protein HflX